MKRVAAVALLPLLATIVTPSAQENNDPDPLRTEEGLRRVLDKYEEQYEKTCGRLAEALWKDRTSGPVPAPLAEARASLRKLYTDPELKRVIERWIVRQTVTRDPLLTERVRVWAGTTALAAVELEPSIAALTDQLSHRIASHRYLVDGERVGLDQLKLTLRFSGDREERRKAWFALGTGARMLRADVMKVIRMRAVEVRALRARNYPHLMYSANDLDPLWIQKAMSVISRTTVRPYEDLLQRIREALDIEELAPWDLDHGVEVLAKARGTESIEAEAFPPGRTVEVVEALLKTLGLDPQKIALRATQGVIPTDYLDIPVHIPDDLRLVTLRSPPRGLAAGVPGYDSLARAYTRSALAAFNMQTAPILKGYDCLPATRNTAWVEGIARTISLFMRDPIFLKKQLDLSDKEIELLHQTMRDRELMKDRWLILDAGMDYIMYSNPDADLDRRYKKLFRTSLLVDMADTVPSTWAADPWFFNGPPLHHVHLQSRAIAGDLYQRIINEFGDKRLDPEVIGPWLKENIFGPGEGMLLLDKLTHVVKGGYGLKNYYGRLGISVSQ